MKKMLIPGLIIFFSAIALVRCTNQNLTEEDRIQIAIEVVKTLKEESSVVEPNSDLAKLKNLISIKIAPFSEPITVPKARELHQEYLKSPNPILDSNEKIVHSLSIDDNHLDTLSKYSVNGARLYFLDEDGSFSIALVAIAADGTNVLTAPGEPNRSVVINKLDPCPTECLTEPGSATRNDPSDLNYNTTKNYWLKPNIRQGLRIWANADNVIKE
jgi:hypothetical protein